VCVQATRPVPLIKDLRVLSDLTHYLLLKWREREREREREGESERGRETETERRTGGSPD
jgi:hypothetical protein